MLTVGACWFLVTYLWFVMRGSTEHRLRSRVWIFRKTMVVAMPMKGKSNACLVWCFSFAFPSMDAFGRVKIVAIAWLV